MNNNWIIDEWSDICQNPDEYTEGKDFITSMKKWIYWDEVFFNSLEWSLLGYIRYTQKSESEKFIVFCINDTVSSHSIEKYWSEGMKKKFYQNWYNQQSLANFWVTMYEYIINHFRSIAQWREIIIAINSLDRNKEQMERLIKKIKERMFTIIARSTWGGEFSMATIFINAENQIQEKWK
jgi:hypothetical protein